jgi:hypothetical protein
MKRVDTSTSRPEPAVVRSGKIKIVKPFCGIERDGIG